MRTPIEPLANPYHAGTLPEEAWHGLLRKDKFLHADVSRVVRERLVATFHVPPLYDRAQEEPAYSRIGFPVYMPIVRRDGDWHMDEALHASGRATFLFLSHARGHERGRSCPTGYIPGMVAHAALRNILQGCQRADGSIEGMEEVAVFQQAINTLGKTTRTHAGDAMSTNAALEALTRARWEPLPGIHRISYGVHTRFTHICSRIRWLRPGTLAVFADDSGLHSALHPTRKNVPPASLIQGHALYKNSVGTKA